MADPSLLGDIIFDSGMGVHDIWNMLLPILGYSFVSIVSAGCLVVVVPWP